MSRSGRAVLVRSKAVKALVFSRAERWRRAALELKLWCLSSWPPRDSAIEDSDWIGGRAENRAQKSHRDIDLTEALTRS